MSLSREGDCGQTKTVSNHVKTEQHIGDYAGIRRTIMINFNHVEIQETHRR